MGATYETFDRLRREGRDTIWAYVARNLSRPLAFSVGGGTVNVLVGNPPWVAYRHMSADLQKRFKELAQGEKVYVGGRFATQNDLCALFTVRASHLYLRPSGRIAFVLPLAALTRGQFEKFRTGRFGSYNVAWDEAWTMDDSVTPLFPVPSCVVFGRKRAIAQVTPDKVIAYHGNLPMRDAPEAVADIRLRVAVEAAPEVGEFEGGSPYRERFRQGATLVPRMLNLIEHKALGRLGADTTAPLVRSRRSLLEKEPWRGAEGVENQVEAEFLRPIVLGESILPYRLLQTFEGVAPISGKFVLDSSEAIEAGFTKVGAWLTKSERVWKALSAGTMTLKERWNFQRGLSNQLPIAPVRVLYASSGSIPAALVIKDTRAIIDNSLYWAATEENEANYLASIFNSEQCRIRVERYQARGQFGARHFHKVMFNLPIPVFDPGDESHQAIAVAGRTAEHVASLVELVDGERFQRARKRVRDALAEDGIGAEIEKLVDRLLGPA